MRIIDEPKFLAGVEMIGRTGAKNFQIRFSDDDEPTVWVAIAEYEEIAECDASIDPVRAVLRLAERLVDGGFCTHCSRPTGLDPDCIETMPMNNLICWYQYDPELRKFRRGCE